MFVRPGGFVVVLPVKSPGTAKSRLSAVPDDQRAVLAEAFAVDAVDACLGTPGVAGVLVVTDDEAFGSRLAARGAQTCADPGHGLNGALRHAASTAHAVRPDLRPVAMCADLPALRESDLAAALAFAADVEGPCFVQDADGTGTTLYTAAYDDFAPRFGPGSARTHSEVATPIPGPLVTLRRDVDDVDGLSEAVGIGLRPASARALASLPSPWWGR